MFREFCIYEKMTGGPDPHMADVLYTCENLPFEEKIWRTLLYAGVYNVPTAEAIWRKFPVYPGSNLLFAFFYSNWDGLRFRRERKTVGLDSTHGTRLTDYCGNYRTVLESLKDNPIPFEEGWRLAMGLRHVGRYCATKLTECWFRMGFLSEGCPDIRPRGGWSPRAALSLLYPTTNHDPYNNEQLFVSHAEMLTREAHAIVPELTMYELEVLLCEYKTSYSTKRQYPGRSLDSEMSYEQSAYGYWGVDNTEHLRTRKLLHPGWALAEVGDWDPDRRLKNLGRVLSKYGYTWSDYLFDYNRTTDFSNPVKREGI
jgi:hypothetical protein